MLRACQRAVAQLQGVVSSGTAAGKKPFDPSGPLSQIDTLAEGLDHNDPMVKIALDMKNLKVAVEKLKAEEAMRSDGVPPGLATKQDGSLDESYYVKSQGFHPDFVKELKASMQEEANAHLKPKKDDSWEKAKAKLAPIIEQSQEDINKQATEIRAKLKLLDDFEERLEEITVDEMLEKYPQLAQEIKDEIEAGVWEPTNAGYKIGQSEVAASH